MREHPNEFWYQAAVVLYVGLARKLGVEPSAWALLIPWQQFLGMPTEQRLTLKLEWDEAGQPVLSLRAEGVRAGELRLHHGPPLDLECEVD